jgi:hypothetical protein
MATPPDFVNATALDASSLNKVGLWLIKTQTIGTAVGSVTVTNAFNDDYQNYKIIVSAGTSNTAQAIQFQLGPSSVSGYNANYSYVLDIRRFTDGSQILLFSDSASSWAYIGEANTSANTIDIDIFSPKLAKNTTYSGFYGSTTNPGVTNGIQKNNGQYTDFTIFVAGNMTGGTIRVYGYRS